MKHSDIINLILSELDKNGLSLHSHSEIHNTLLPHEKFSSYRSNWSNWLQGKSQRINNAHAKRVITALTKQSNILPLKSTVDRATYMSLVIWVFN